MIGENDLQVPYRENLGEIEAALKAGGNTDYTIAPLPGLNHLFPDQQDRLASRVQPNRADYRASSARYDWRMDREARPLTASERRRAESPADFIHKLGIMQKELNETSVWLRIVLRLNLGKRDQIVALYQENVELARIITASIRTAKTRLQGAPK